MNQVKIVVDEIPPSNNKYMGNSHSHHIYRQDKQKWEWLIKANLKPNQIPKEPFEKVAVDITYYFPTKHRRDPDNYSGKFIMDSLTNNGIICDDSFDEVKELNLSGEYDKDNPRTEIVIKRLD